MIVVDASVAIKWIAPEEQNSKETLFLLELHKKQKEEIIVPRLLFYEVANYLATKSKTHKKTIREALRILIDANLKIHEEKPNEFITTAIYAKEYGTSVYDMSYALIAKQQRIKLITADERFKERTKFPFVVLLKDYKKRV